MALLQPEVKPYQFHAYPLMLYHPSKDGRYVIVDDEEQEEAQRAAWASEGEAAPDGRVSYPRWLHHASKPSVMVRNKDEADALGSGWADTPAAALGLSFGGKLPEANSGRLNPSPALVGGIPTETNIVANAMDPDQMSRQEMYAFLKDHGNPGKPQDKDDALREKVRAVMATKEGD